MKFISIVSPCYNEEENVESLYNQVKDIFKKLDGYSYEHIFIDNSSKDKTIPVLKDIAKVDKNVKIIVNSRNFGWITSPIYGLLQANGDAIILLVSDLQDPPGLILDFIKKWEEGYKVVIGIKKLSHESRVMFSVRKLYYNLVNRLSGIDLIKNFTGFGLYDKSIIEILRSLEDPYPYFRGIVAEVGFERAEIEYTQPVRQRGVSYSNFYRLFDVAMLGITNHSKVPLRVATMLGFSMSLFCVGVSIVYLIYKLVYWRIFSTGVAPLVIGLFFFSSVQLFFIGIIGEYVGVIFTQVRRRPLVIEKERINF